MRTSGVRRGMVGQGRPRGLIFLRPRPSPLHCAATGNGRPEVGTLCPIVKMMQRIAFTGDDGLLLLRRGGCRAVVQQRACGVPNVFVVTGGAAAIEPKIVGALTNFRVRK